LGAEVKESVSRKQYRLYLKEICAGGFADKKVCWDFYFSIILLLVGTTSNLLTPFLLKKIVESLSSQSLLIITPIFLGYGVTWTIGQLSNHIRAFLMCKVEQRITSTLETKVLSHLYSLSHSYFLNQKPGALMNIIRRAQRDVPTLLLGLFFHVLPTVFEFLFVVSLILVFYPLVYGLLMGGTLLAFFFCNSLFIQGVLKEREVANEIDKNVDGIVTDWLSNHEAIKVFGKTDLAVETCKREFKKREAAENSFFKKYYLSYIRQALILGVGLSVLTYLIGCDVLHGLLTIGDFILLNGYVLHLVFPIGLLGQIVQDIRKALINMKGIFELLSTLSDVKEEEKPRPLVGPNFSVQFEHVSFRYDNRNVLKNVSFKVEAGQTALIVGETGIGKSTIAKLLLRLYDPTDGKVMIEGVNVRQVSLKSLCQSASWVPQETSLLNDTIKANIQLARPESTITEIEEALDLACLLDFVRKLPWGLDTIVGDRGLKLSGGEKQRISIARLFLKKPKICIFDESTSSLDNETSLIIQNNIERFFLDATKIIITHHPSFIHKVDKVISIGNNGV
jgi:ABC-type multidrug transport system fused ATPase/permease subunit